MYLIIAFLRIKGMPFNCEANQFQDFQIESCGESGYEFYESIFHGDQKSHHTNRCKTIG